MFHKRHLTIVLSLFAILALTVVLNAQQVIDKSLSASTQSELPVSTESYTPAGNFFTWSFTFQNRYQVPYRASTVFPQVVDSDLTRPVHSVEFSPNTVHKISGENWTGTGQDYLRISAATGSYPDNFYNMELDVHYYSRQQE